MPTINRKVKRLSKVSYRREVKDIDYAKFYNNKAWRMLRNKYFAEHPLCEDCLANGMTTPAQEVHHIIPFSTGHTENELIDLLLDENNLKSLCVACHHRYHRKSRRGHLEDAR